MINDDPQKHRYRLVPAIRSRHCRDHLGLDDLRRYHRDFEMTQPTQISDLATRLREHADTPITDDLDYIQRADDLLNEAADAIDRLSTPQAQGSEAVALPKSLVDTAYAAAEKALHGTSGDIGAGELERVVIAALTAALASPSQVKPMRLHFDREAMRQSIKDDPDLEAEAGRMHPEAQEDRCKPIAWRVAHGGGFTIWNSESIARKNAEATNGTVRPLYATPPVQAQPQGVLTVAEVMAKLSEAIEAERADQVRHNEMLATVIANVEKSEPTAEFAVALRDYVREARTRLSALATPPAPVDGGVTEIEPDVFECSTCNQIVPAPPLRINERALDAARKSVSTIPGSALWLGVETAVRAYNAALTSSRAAVAQDETP